MIHDICHVVFTPFSYVIYVTLTPSFWVWSRNHGKA